MIPFLIAKKVFGFAKDKYDDRHNQDYNPDSGYERPRRKILLPILALIAVLFSLIGIVLAAVAIVAGSNTSTISDGYIVQFNTTGLGKNLDKAIFSGVKLPDVKLPFKNPFSVRDVVLDERTDVPTVHELAQRQTIDPRNLLTDAGKGLAKVGTDLVKDPGQIVDSAKDVVKNPGQAVDTAKDIVKGGVDAVTGAVGDVIGDILKKLGIKGVYNLHVMNICNGDVDKDKGGAANISFCTAPLQNQNSFLDLLDKELKIGPLPSINFAKLGIAGELQEKINDVTAKLNLLAGIYIAGAAFGGLGLLASIVAVIILFSIGKKDNSPGNKVVVIALANMFFFFMSTLLLAAGSAITTFAANIAVEKITEHGSKIGLSATRGVKFQGITWSAVAFLGLAWVLWIVAGLVAIIQARKAKNAEAHVFGDSGLTPLPNQMPSFANYKVMSYPSDDVRDDRPMSYLPQAHHDDPYDRRE